MDRAVSHELFSFQSLPTEGHLPLASSGWGILKGPACMEQWERRARRGALQDAPDKETKIRPIVNTGKMIAIPGRLV
jgi:hypothetical protein